ncbi:GntP family permease [Actinotalea sp. BY-33]|uniref:GntP family permease n=1 Tax=Actinotalea soli TaxID=2819234 RepID=A0A939LRL3_9CELL|nr:GntP family permease [Actinotalea soli]
METEEWTQTLTAGPLLGIAAGAVALLLVLIIKFRLHAFLSLILVSLLTALVSGIPAPSVLDELTSGFGGTLASVALLVGLGAMLGRMVETSGGAKVMADTLISRFGEKRAPFALGVASLIFGFPIFFDAGLVVMLPIVFAVARRLGGSVLTYGLPTAGAFSVMHIFVPPHPGPVAASELLGADPGVVIILGLVLAVPTWYVTSYLFGVWAGKRWVLPVPEILGNTQDEDLPDNPPSLGTVLALLLLPLMLIFLNTGLNTLRAAGVVDGEATWYALASLVGSTPVALLIAVLVAAVVLGKRRGRDKSVIEKLLDSALGPVASVILITGAGGMFGGVLRASGIGEALAEVLGDVGMPVIVAGFLVATILRVAQGSATVALTTAAALIQPAVDAGSYSSFQLGAIVLAVAAGSVMISHVNDSGFWLVGRFFGMDVRTTLKT